MRVDLSVRAFGVADVESLTIKEAVHQHEYPRTEVVDTRYEGVTVAGPGLAAPDLGVQATLHALDAFDGDADGIGVTIFATAAPPPLEIWSPVSYVLNKTGLGRMSSFTLGAGCAGGVQGLHAAAAHVTAWGYDALVVAAEHWGGVPNRWQLQKGILFADHAVSVIVGPPDRPGVARLVAISTTTIRELEAMHRQGVTWYDPEPPKLDDREQAFRWANKDVRIGETLDSGLLSEVGTVLADAGVTMADVALVTTPAIGYDLARRKYWEPLDLPPAQTSWDFAKHHAHAGSPDPLAAVADAIAQERVRSGDVVLAIGEGAGMHVGAALFAIV